jgi:hypothetical protein
MYDNRSYRGEVTDHDLVSFKVSVGESDLFIRANSRLDEVVRQQLIKSRGCLIEYLNNHPEVANSLKPLPLNDQSHHLLREMFEASRITGVGPMAAVAGAIAEEVGRQLLNYFYEVIVENGGDIFIKVKNPRTVSIYAGESIFSGKIGFKIYPDDTPLGICTSSGTVGHSLSFGTADAVCVLAKKTALADAAATALANRVKTIEDISSAIQFARRIPELKAVIVIKDDKLGSCGDVELVSIHNKKNQILKMHNF